MAVISRLASVRTLRGFVCFLLFFLFFFPLLPKLRRLTCRLLRRAGSLPSRSSICFPRRRCLRCAELGWAAEVRLVCFCSGFSSLSLKFSLLCSFCFGCLFIFFYIWCIWALLGCTVGLVFQVFKSSLDLCFSLYEAWSLSWSVVVSLNLFFL